jgi:dephospho-CoA kinase
MTVGCGNTDSRRVLFSLRLSFFFFLGGSDHIILRSLSYTTAMSMPTASTYTSNKNNNNNNNHNDFRILGVCGGIGSGKSTASKLLVSECNCWDHLDADSIAHSVYAPGSQAMQDIVSEFGSSILIKSSQYDNDHNDDYTSSSSHLRMEIDRKKLGAVVFADPTAMAKLEHIVWPHVKTLLLNKLNTLRQEWQDQQEKDEIRKETIQNCLNRRPIVVLEAAVLLDAGWDDLLDGLWVITAPREVALHRLVQTRGLTLQEGEKRLDSQRSRRGIGNLQQEIDNGTVTGIIENHGELEDLTMSLRKALDNPSFWKPK